MGIELVEVIFKARRVGVYANPLKLEIKPDDYVVVEADRGEDLGKVGRMGSITHLPDEEQEQIKNVLRLATVKDIYTMERNRNQEEEALKICKQKVAKHNLNMNVVDTEYQLDHKKVTFYFTSENRVDFRELVKDLAAKFRARIELRQIGVRDAARHIGGCGVCGYQLCCTTFIRNFESISLQYAKEQLLPTNPTRLTGICGRLKCCLSYERQFYLKEIERYPRLDEPVQTPRGEGWVEKVDIFHRLIYIRYADDETIKYTLEEFEKLKTLA